MDWTNLKLNVGLERWLAFRYARMPLVIELALLLELR